MFRFPTRGSTISIAAAIALLSLADVASSSNPWPVKGLLALVCVAAFFLLQRGLPQSAEPPPPSPHPLPSRDDFRNLFDTAPAGMALLQPNGAIVRVNLAFCRWLGQERDSMLQRNWWNLLDSKDLEASLASVTRLLGDHPETVQFEAHFRHKDSRLLFGNVAMALLPDELLLAYVIDISVRFESEQRVRRLNQELEQRVAQLTELHQDIATFTSSISHDLRAPLRQMDGFSRILLDDFGSNASEEARNAALRIREAVQNMSRMLEDLLQLSRLGRHRLSRVACDMKLLVDQVVVSLGPEWEGRTVEWRIGDLPFLDCDPGLMRKLLENLLSNAIKFTRRQQAAVIEVGSQWKEGQPVIFVRDNGVGFPPSQAGKLFTVFQRLHRSEDFEGTGVGLASVNRIVQLHGGSVWAESELGHGATFFFQLERASADNPVEAQTVIV